VEIGTANGYSALWLCLGLRTTGGRLTTFEVDPQAAAMARANFVRAGVDRMVTIIEGDAHKTIDRLREPIDLLFLDADKQGYVDYLNRLLPLVRPGGLILADNMSRPTPSPAFIKAITTNPNLETVFVNMPATGLGIILKKR
jgi:caffeoyl-CoA O-methyltransferase